MNWRISILFCIILLLAVLPHVSLVFAATSSQNASIQAADSSINEAFQNVLAAEKSGSNVTQLLMNLNNAASLLAEADNTYQSGDANSFASNANNARLIANEVSSNALALQQSSESQSQSRFLFIVVLPVTAAFIYVVVMLVIWIGFRRRYNKRFLSLKPAVVSNGA